MADAHAAAAAGLLAGSGTEGAASSTLDMHGLHVAEALAAVASRLAALRASAAAGRAGGERSGGSLTIITGVGAHSSHAARLAPAVRGWLEEGKGGRGVRWRERAGTFVVEWGG